MTRRDLLASTTSTASAGLGLALTLARPGSAAASQTNAVSDGRPIALGTRRELFVDRFLIDRLSGAADLRLAQPYDAGPILALDRPWEGRFCGYATVIKEGGGKFHLYYRGVPNAGQDGRGDEVYCYAESSDGVKFTRPNLGLHEVHGTRNNNVILANTPPLQHNFSPFLDTSAAGAAGAARFKGVAGTRKSGLVAFQSADGVRWSKMREAPILTEGAFDSQNLAFWSEAEQRYLCYYRTFKKIGGTGYRWISRAVSTNFLDWENQGEMSFGEAPPEHLYTNQTSPYFRAPHIYIAICARFLPGRQVLSDDEAKAINVDPGYFKDCSDAVMLSSRGGTRYDRTFLDAFVRPGLGVNNWVSRSNYPALNLVQTGENEMSMYVVRNYGQPSIYLRRYTMRLDGIASVHAGYAGGEMVTKPFTFAGSQLEVNFATSAPGGIVFTLEDARSDGGAAALAESYELIGDLVARQVRWKNGVTSLANWAGKPVRLRARLKDADLYALRFVA